MRNDGDEAMTQDKKEEEVIIRVLSQLALVIEQKGFPKEPMIIESNPEAPICFFICLWRNAYGRKLELIGA